MKHTLSKARRGLAAKSVLGAGMLATGVACAALAPAANAATASEAAASPTITKQYTVQIAPNVINGKKVSPLQTGSTVKATAVISAPESKVSNWWNQKTITTVVNRGFGGGADKSGVPYISQGYRCSMKQTPVKGQAGTTLSNFTCKLQGADVPTSIKLTFSAVQRGDVASG